VPALAGAFSGTLRTSKETVAIGGATGYHDHNWGFWDGVSWQWGQVASDDLSIVFGQVFPPPDAADETRIPGFMAVLGPRGPLGFATDVVIDDHDLPRIEVRARGRGVDLRLTFMVEETTRTSRMMARRPSGPPMDFLQLGGVYHARGRVGDRNVDFTARGSAETFRQH
jgi:hypothetical protein